MTPPIGTIPIRVAVLAAEAHSPTFDKLPQTATHESPPTAEAV